MAKSLTVSCEIIFPQCAPSKLRLKCDGTRTITRFRLSAKRTSPFKSAVASVQSTTGSRGFHISGSYSGYTMFRDSVKSTGYPLHSPVSPSLPPSPCVTVFHRISIGLYVLPLSKLPPPPPPFCPHFFEFWPYFGSIHFANLWKSDHLGAHKSDCSPIERVQGRPCVNTRWLPTADWTQSTRQIQNVCWHQES